MTFSIVGVSPCYLGSLQVATKQGISGTILQFKEVTLHAAVNVSLRHLATTACNYFQAILRLVIGPSRELRGS